MLGTADRGGGGGSHTLGRHDARDCRPVGEGGVTHWGDMMLGTTAAGWGRGSYTLGRHG